MERTLIILKPDAVQRRLIGRLLQRFEEKGLAIAALKMVHIDRNLAERHYAVHQGKPFYEPLLRFMMSAPVVVVVAEGCGAVAVVRKMMGPTFGAEAEPGTIRGDFGTSNRYNLVHGSDSPETAEREVALFFRPEEILAYEPGDWQWTDERA